MNLSRFVLAAGGRELKDEYGLYDNMTPVSALATEEGLTLAIYFTKPPTRGGLNPQEIHMLRLAPPPQDVSQVYHSRTPDPRTTTI